MSEHGYNVEPLTEVHRADTKSVLDIPDEAYGAVVLGAVVPEARGRELLPDDHSHAVDDTLTHSHNVTCTHTHTDRR